VPAEGGPVVFITTTCPPYAGYPPPELQDAAHDAGDPCVAAFAAYYSDAGACTGVDGATPETGTDAAQDAPDGAPPPDATVESGAMPEAGEAGVVDAGPDAPGEAATGD